MTTTADRLEAIGSTVRVVVLAAAAVPLEEFAALEDAGALASEPLLEAFAEFRARLEGIELAALIEAEEVVTLCSRCGQDEAESSGFCMSCEFDYAAESRVARELAEVAERKANWRARSPRPLDPTATDRQRLHRLLARVKPKEPAPSWVDPLNLAVDTLREIETHVQRCRHEDQAIRDAAEHVRQLAWGSREATA